jgi:DNA-binding response OmpR family regulator
VATILIVEDERHLAEGLKFNLEAEGHSVTTVPEGEQALDLLGNGNSFDALVLDVMLPGKDGFQIASELRKHGEYIPILMLTARGRAEDVLKGFESGADDYLPKPFELPILLARVNALLRRSEWLREQRRAPKVVYEVQRPTRKQDTYVFSGKIVDFANLELRVDEKHFRLTAMEMDLMRYLIKNANRVVSRKAILEDVWGLHEDTDTRAIDNFIVRLRRYLEADSAHPKHLLTVRGVGYKFVP